MSTIKGQLTYGPTSEEQRDSPRRSGLGHEFSREPIRQFEVGEDTLEKITSQTHRNHPAVP